MTQIPVEYFYVWTGKDVKVIPPLHWSRYEGHYIFDPEAVDLEYRWGKPTFKKWYGVPREEVPKEFLATLLLLGFTL